MKQITMSFGECEHQGDLDYYITDIVECGGRIISSHLSGGEDGVYETGHVTFEVADSVAFTEKFKLTDAWGFRNT